MTIEMLIDILHREKCSCVIYNEEVRTFHKRGIRDIHELLKSEPDFLKGALIADKIIGRAAAAVLIVGGVKELYTDIISDTAMELLKGADIRVSYGKKIEYIQNRKGTDLCPMEKACKGVESAMEAIQILDNWTYPKEMIQD